MKPDRLSHPWLWITLIILLIVAVAIGVFVSLSLRKPTRTVVVAPSRPAPQQPATTYDAASSWKVFVDDARAKCEKEGPDCTVDYTALHDYGQGSYGVMIIGYRDSEYITDLYRYDPSTREWTPAPKRSQMDGYEVVDTAAASQQWGVPQEELDAWITEAEKGVQHTYQQRAQQENEH